jgi:hypothetical protein
MLYQLLSFVASWLRLPRNEVAAWSQSFQLHCMMRVSFKNKKSEAAL